MVPLPMSDTDRPLSPAREALLNAAPILSVPLVTLIAGLVG